MKKENEKRKAIKDLQSLMNIGPAMAKRLYAIGITTPSQLKNSNPERVYEKLKQNEGGHLDICALYQLRGASLNAPWWVCKNWKGDKNMTDKHLAPVCGLYCGSCEYYKNPCEGCGNIKGKPFWTTQMKVEVCPLYGCCINKKQLEHCGLCEELPCETFNKFHDPSLSPEEAKQAVLKRQKELLKRKEIGTERWLQEKG